MLATLVTESVKTSNTAQLAAHVESERDKVWEAPCGLIKTVAVDGGHVKGWTVAPTWCWEFSSSGQQIAPLVPTEPMHRGV